jgi:hypothetical protein
MKKIGRRRFRDYAVCLLPFAGVPMAGVYLYFFGLIRELKSYYDERKSPDLSVMLDNLKAFRQHVGPQAFIEMNNAVSASDSIAWGYASGLGLLVMICVTLVAAYVIWKSIAEVATPQRTVVTIFFCLLAFSSFQIVDKLIALLLSAQGFLSGQSMMHSQLVEIVRQNFVWSERFNIPHAEKFFLIAGFGAAFYLIIAAGVSLLPPVQSADNSNASSKSNQEEIEHQAMYTARQMKHLRAVLYAGAILLVIITFRLNVTMRWALDYLQPPAALDQEVAAALPKYLFQRLEILVANMVTSIGIYNTILLAGLYVPGAAILQRRAMRLVTRLRETKPTGQPSGEGLTKQQKEWMEEHGLVFPLRDQLPKIAAILSPLLAGPMGQLLGFFK